MSVSRRIKKLWDRLAQPRALRVLYHGLFLAPRLLLHVASVAALAGLFELQKFSQRLAFVEASPLWLFWSICIHHRNELFTLQPRLGSF